MREIKFRAWDNFQKQYVCTGFHVCGEVTALGGMESVIGETWKERSEKLGYKTTLEAWNDFEFEQFTGLKDKNGKEIYEGDIVKWDYKENELCISKVIFHRGMYCIDPEKKDDWYPLEAYLDQNIEVIGNIHQNPDLLTR